MNKIVHKAALAVMLPLMVTACTTDLTGTSYSSQEARQMQVVRFGSVYEVRPVKLSGSEGEIGTLAGAATGGIVAGSNIGGGSGSSVAAIAGALAGGVLGNMAEKKLTAKQGLEITVKLEDGSYVSVVQEADPNNALNPGDKVKVMTQGRGNSRVVKAHQ